jgi:hypothetical protein
MFQTTFFSFLRISYVWAAVRGRALLCNNRTLSDSLPLLLEQIAGFNPLWSMSKQQPCDSCSMFQVGLKNRPLRIPEFSQHQLTCRWLHLEFLCNRRWRMLPLHGLLLGFWLIVVNPGFIACDDSLQKVAKWREQMPECMRLCSSVSSLGTHLAYTLWNWRLSCIQNRQTQCWYSVVLQFRQSSLFCFEESVP